MSDEGVHQESAVVADDAEDSEVVGDNLVDVLPPGVAKNVPQEVRSLMASVMQYSGPMVPPYMAKMIDKMKPEHITYLLESADRNRDRDRSDARESRVVTIVILVVLLVFSGIVIRMLSTTNSSLLMDLLNWAALLGSGLVGGMGLQSWRTRRK